MAYSPRTRGGAPPSWATGLRLRALMSPPRPTGLTRTAPPAYPIAAGPGLRIRRAFNLDVLACPACGGRLRLIALIVDPRTTRAILDACDRPTALADRARLAGARRSPRARLPDRPFPGRWCHGAPAHLLARFPLDGRFIGVVSASRIALGGASREGSAPYRAGFICAVSWERDRGGVPITACSVNMGLVPPTLSHAHLQLALASIPYSTPRVLSGQDRLPVDATQAPCPLPLFRGFGPVR